MRKTIKIEDLLTEWRRYDRLMQSYVNDFELSLPRILDKLTPQEKRLLKYYFASCVLAELCEDLSGEIVKPKNQIYL